MTERHGFFENLKAKATHGWEGLKQKLFNGPVFVEESRAEIAVVGDSWGRNKEIAKTAWGMMGDNLKEKLQNTVKVAGVALKAGVEYLKKKGNEAFEDVRKRYEVLGIARATGSLVADAINSVTSLPTEIAAKLNASRTEFQNQKIDKMLDTTDKLMADKPLGWAERVDRIDNAIGHVAVRRDEFNKRRKDCEERLTIFAMLRTKLESAKTKKVTAEAVAPTPVTTLADMD